MSTKKSTKIIAAIVLIAILSALAATPALAACPPNDLVCQATQAAQQIGAGVKSITHTYQQGGFWQAGLAGGWRQTPTVPGAGTVFGLNGQQVLDAARQFNRAAR